MPLEVAAPLSSEVLPDTLLSEVPVALEPLDSLDGATSLDCIPGVVALELGEVALTPAVPDEPELESGTEAEPDTEPEALAPLLASESAADLSDIELHAASEAAHANAINHLDIDFS